MRAVTIFALVLSGCLLDPTGELKKASLKVDVSGLGAGTDLVVSATDSKGTTVSRKNPLAGQTSFEVIFIAGSLANGPVTVNGVVHDASGKELACGSAMGTVAAGAVLPMAMSATDTLDDCGACGHACTVPANATVACVMGVCGTYSCKGGFIDLDGLPDNGCEYECTAVGDESSEISCTDGADNDCNGVKDCQEDACQMLLRDCAFMSCTGKQKFECATQTWDTCEANNSGENDVASCSDGNDNDCDGLKDCTDPGCQGIARDCAFMSCTGSQIWDCASQTWGTCEAQTGAETTVAACSDGADNDCDGLFDCMDPDCQGITQVCTYQTCNGSQSWDCSAQTWSTCTVDQALESTIASCSDHIDNDCDGKKDCADDGCQHIQVACGANVCLAGVELWLCGLGILDGICLQLGSNPEDGGSNCHDGIDNDCDGKIDCLDNSCTGKSCATGKTCCVDGGCAASCE